MKQHSNKEATNIDDDQTETLHATIGAITFAESGAGDCAPGSVLGEAYEVLALIGKGGMGNVYRVRHKIMEKEFALKTLSNQQVTDVAWRRFQNEAQAIARLNHPNVVSISNLGLHQGYLPYYVMDLLDGKTLFEILEARRTLPVNEALSIFIEACAGIGYAHKKGIVHRDIKPGNIVILDKPDASSRLKIVDFGIAKLSGIKDLPNQQLTNAGEICGSPLYMSPEQCNSGRIDARSDVYSLGCTLFETLTGTPPFKGASAVETMLMHQNSEPPSLKTAAGGKPFPHMLESIVASMLAKTPMDRYQNMELVAQDLSAALADKDQPINPYATKSTTSVSAISSTTARTLDDEKYKQRPPGREFSRPAAIAGTGALFLGAAAVLFGTTQLIFKKAPQDYAAIEKSQMAQTSKLGDTSEDLFKNIPDVAGEGTDQPKAVYSATDTEPFSHDKIVGGKMYKVFNFPKDIVVGIIRDDRDTTYKMLCLNDFEKPPERKMVLTPGANTERYPQYLKRFRAGDLYGVTFSDDILNDKTFAAASVIPGLRKLKIENCASLTKKSLPVLYKFDSLIDFRYGDGPFSAQDIINMPRFKYLTTLFYSGKDVTQVLLASQRADKMEELNLLRSQISKQDIDIISNISHLKRLTIKNTAISSEDVRKLAKLTELKILYLDDCKIAPDAVSHFAHFKSLEKLGLFNVELSGAQIQELKAGWPNKLVK